MSAVLRAGQELAGYRVEEQLARGGMGVVYKATQLSLGRTVALKVLAPHLSSDAEFAERFRREAALQARLEHPNIVTVYETGESEEGLFLAMQFVEGTDLKRLIEAGDLSPEHALRILEQVAAALDAAHEGGLVHRDIKPQNVLVDGQGRAYLADFGLTKSSGSRGITRTGAYLGSLDYVSPEQVRGDEVTSATDRYAFASVLYEALAGEVPFPRDTEAALLYAHVSEPPPRLSERRPGLPPSVDDVLARGLAKDPAGRYPTATQLIRDAQAALELLCAGLAAAGFLLGHSRTGIGPLPDGTAVAGPLSLRYPTRDWSAGSAQTTLRDSVLLRGHGRTRRGSLLAGFAPVVDARTLLPQGAEHGKGSLVRLGGYEALRYRGAGHTRFAVPVGRGALLILCSGKAETLRRCESVATTIVVQGVEPGRIGPDPRFAAALGKAVTHLDAVRVPERRALAGARSPDARAGHAEVLATTYATASAQLQSIPAGPRERLLQARLLRALGRARDGYVLLGASLRAR